MNSLQNLIQRLSAIGQVNEEAKKPDDDNDGVPNWADKKPGADDNEKVDEAKKPNADGDDEDYDDSGPKDHYDPNSKPYPKGHLNKLLRKKLDEPEVKDGDDKVKESALDLLRRHSGIQEAAPVNFDKVLDAIAALYGDDMWNNDSMQDLAHDLEQQNPTEQELDSIIATGELPQRLANTQFTNNITGNITGEVLDNVGYKFCRFLESIFNKYLYII